MALYPRNRRAQKGVRNRKKDRLAAMPGAHPIQECRISRRQEGGWPVLAPIGEGYQERAGKFRHCAERFGAYRQLVPKCLTRAGITVTRSVHST